MKQDSLTSVRQHNGLMDRKPNGRANRQLELAGYMADERVPAAERGGVMLGLFGHAVVFMVLTCAQATWCAVTAVRVWRRREAGWPAALRDGVHRPTLAGLVTATAAYTVLRRLGLAAIIRRAREHAARSADAGS
jgi:hypothetical protein